LAHTAPQHAALRRNPTSVLNFPLPVLALNPGIAIPRHIAGLLASATDALNACGAGGGRRCAGVRAGGCGQALRRRDGRRRHDAGPSIFSDGRLKRSDDVRLP